MPLLDVLMLTKLQKVVNAHVNSSDKAVKRLASRLIARYKTESARPESDIPPLSFEKMDEICLRELPGEERLRDENGALLTAEAMAALLRDRLVAAESTESVYAALVYLDRIIVTKGQLYHLMIMQC